MRLSCKYKTPLAWANLRGVRCTWCSRMRDHKCVMTERGRRAADKSRCDARGCKCSSSCSLVTSPLRFIKCNHKSSSRAEGAILLSLRPHTPAMLLDRWRVLQLHLLLNRPAGLNANFPMNFKIWHQPLLSNLKTHHSLSKRSAIHYFT